MKFQRNFNILLTKLDIIRSKKFAFYYLCGILSELMVICIVLEIFRYREIAYIGMRKSTTGVWNGLWNLT